MHKLTSEILTIIWEGDEVSGLTIYGLCGTQEVSRPAFPEDRWPDSNVKEGELFGPNWCVWIWDVQITTWPSDFRDSLNKTLTEIVNAGASVAWCGLEGFFVEPPNLFESPMAGGVYAAFSLRAGFICNTDLHAPFRSLTEAEILGLRP